MRVIEDDLRTGTGDGRHVVELTADWNVIGVNGGYLAAALLSAAEQHRAGMSPVSLTVQFSDRTIPGELTVSVSCVRESAATALLLLTGEQQGRTTVFAQLWLATDGGRRVDLPSDRVMSEVGPEGLLEVDKLRRRGGLPVHDIPLYTQVEERPVDWWDPAQRSATAPLPRRMRSWLRMAPTPRRSPWSVARRACVLLDAYPIMALIRSTPYGVSGSVVTSLNLHVEFDDPDEQDPEWWFGEFAAVGSSRGSVEAVGTLWTRSGSRVAAGDQRVLTQALHRGNDAARRMQQPEQPARPPAERGARS